MSFLQRLKGKGVDAEKLEKESKEQKQEALTGVQQIAIDLVELDNQIVIFAALAGSRIEDTQVTVEGDNDVVIIQGTVKRPENDILSEGQQLDGKFFAEDIKWGEFYRKVILPEPVDIKRAQVKMKKGVLMMRLPLLKTSAPQVHTLTISGE